MTAPSPAVYVSGQGSVSADGLNTFIQNVSTFAQLRTFTGLSNMVVYVAGGASVNDGNQGNFYYNSTSTATDNGSTVIVPNGAVQGAWLRLLVTVASVQTVRYVTTGSTDSALNTDTTIVWNSATALSKTETLPAPTTQGQTFNVKDGYGNSATYNITVNTSAGSIVGTNVINAAYGSLTFQADGVSKWLVI